MSIQINTIDCNKNQAGTGVPGCLLRSKAYKSFLLVTKPIRLDAATDTLDADYILARIQDGTFVPFLNTVEFLNNTPERTTKEYQGGVMRTIRNGMPMYSFEFDNGPLWHGAAYAYNSFQAYGIILIDKAGTIEMAKSADGTYIYPYPLSDFNVSTYRPEVGDDTAGSLIEFQIMNEETFNMRKALIPVSASGVDVNSEMYGVIDVIIAGTASAANGISVRVNATLNGFGNEGFGISALTASNFRVRNNATNAVIPIDTVTAGATPGSYVIETDPALVAATVIVVETYDATANVATALIADSNQLYRGASKPITVTA